MTSTADAEDTRLEATAEPTAATAPPASHGG